MSGVKKLSSKAEALVTKRKPKTARGRRILKAREPKVNEDAKKSITLRGNKTDENVLGLLRELHHIRKPLDAFYSKKHEIHPFENKEPVEHLCSKEQASLFSFGSKSKKRPFRLIFGRLFNGGVLDMNEFSVRQYKPESKFPGVIKPLLGSKPLVIFQGAGFDHHPRLKNVRSILLDYFRGPLCERLNLSNVDTAIVFSVVDSIAEESPVIHFRRYRINLRKSQQKTPYGVLQELGPRFELALDREQVAEPEALKAAMRLPKEALSKKVKNIKTDSLGRTKGRLHVGTQDFSKIHTPHFHHKKSKKTKTAPSQEEKPEATPSATEVAESKA